MSENSLKISMRCNYETTTDTIGYLDTSRQTMDTVRAWRITTELTLDW